MEIIDKLGILKGSNKEVRHKMIVWHSAAERVNGVEIIDIFKDYGVSPHFLVYPSGKIVNTYPVDKVGYHAKGFNLTSIGIEVITEGDHDEGIKAYEGYINNFDWVKHNQFESCVWLGKHLQKTLDINKHVRHSDLSPDRKKDPGVGFDFVQLRSRLSNGI